MTTPSHVSRFRRIAVLFLLAVLFCLTGCDSPEGTIREIRKNLDSFKASPNEVKLDELEKSFRSIDAAVKDLEEKEDFAQADLFRRQAMTLRYEFLAMKTAFLKWREGQSVGNTRDVSGK